MKKKFPFYYQLDEMDCGPSCMRMIAHYYGKNYPIKFLRDNSYILKTGISLLGMTQLSNKIGMESKSLLLSINDLNDSNNLPCILYWNQNHFVVLRKITYNFFTKKPNYYISDPAHGPIKLTKERFEMSWITKEKNGVALFLRPTESFYKKTPPVQDKINITYLIRYLIPHKNQILIMFFLLIISSGLTLIFPFLTEALIDKGVVSKDLNFIFIILLAQLSVFVGTITIEIIRNWIMLNIGTHLSIKIISDFLKNMLKLPINFFDTKLFGDIHQRIEDNERIEKFLTSQSLTTFFSILTFSVFFGVLWYYDFKILFIYLSLTVLSIIWSYYWFKKRKKLDYFSFKQRGNNQESIYEILNGVTEIKLNQFDEYKRKEWENIQKELYRLNLRILKIEQIQLSGFNFLNQLKNIIVTFLASSYVVKNQMTLGTLLSISYIIGQMNSPINQLIDFFSSFQYAKLSLERLNEVHNEPHEEQKDTRYTLLNLSLPKKINKREILIKDLYFQYEGPRSPYILKNINLLILDEKITAIVGASGSGKTTLMKLLLSFYTPTMGEIFYNKDNILSLSPKSIRENIGVVLQNGYIFSDTIERNIITKDEQVDEIRFNKAIQISNIKGFVESLPLKYKTKIGDSGNSLSTGQEQRILIARAVYKDPHYVFFDEATSSLDAENEKIIHDNLQKFFKGKTVLIIAHRLSTVKNADQIIVLKNGEIVEKGSHKQLIVNKSEYFNLVKNQLELGN